MSVLLASQSLVSSPRNGWPLSVARYNLGWRRFTQKGQSFWMKLASSFYASLNFRSHCFATFVSADGEHLLFGRKLRRTPDELNCYLINFSSIVKTRILYEQVMSCMQAGKGF
jgi:hypothetical protein